MPSLSNLCVSLFLMALEASLCSSETLKQDSECTSSILDEVCHIRVNSEYARLHHPETVFPTYSCITRNTDNVTQVHIISTHQGTNKYRPINQTPTQVATIQLTLKKFPESWSFPVTLVLTSFEPIKWNLTVKEDVTFKEILLLSYFVSQSDVILNNAPKPTIIRQRKYFGFGRRKRRHDALLAYTRGRYGFVTSFTSVFSVNSSEPWVLDTGISGSCDKGEDKYDGISELCFRLHDGYYLHPRDCSKFFKCKGGMVFPFVCPANTRWSQQRKVCLLSEQVECTSPTTKPYEVIGQAEMCLRSERCWVEYNFTYDDNWTGCGGKQYLTRTKYTEAQYLGVVTCNSTRYKLFLSNSVFDKFENIADSSGHGQDHCELLGGAEGNAVQSLDYWSSPITSGFYRSHWGDIFEHGPIGHGPINGTESTGNLYTSWYECGVTVPGDYEVLPVTEFPEPTLPPTTTSTPSLEFTVKPRNVTGVIGQEKVSLQCSANMRANYLWRKEGTPVKFTQLPGVTETPSGSLIFTHLNMFHEGKYTCEATRDGTHEYIRADAWVHVNYPPPTPTPSCNIVFTEKPQDKVVDSMEQVTFHCKLSTPDGADVNVTWLKDGESLEVHDGDLTINEVLTRNAGEYTCQAKRLDSGCVASASAMLHVKLDGNLTEICGRPSKAPLNARGRIDGGTNAQRGSQPWIVQICRARGNNPYKDCFCGGVLISSRWVLTAAHCLDRTKHGSLFNGQEISQNNLEFKLGQYNMLEEDEPGKVIAFSSQDLIRHPRYSRRTFDNDIALIKLSQDVQFTAQIMPLCLESKGFIKRHFLSIPGQMGVVSGWGQLANGERPPILHEVALPVRKFETCVKATIYGVTHNMFCAGYTSMFRKGGACKGDSGGPFSMKYGDSWYLVGLVSWGDPTKRCDDTYGYYADISNYYDWIMEETDELY